MSHLEAHVRQAFMTLMPRRPAGQRLRAGAAPATLAAAARRSRTRKPEQTLQSGRTRTTSLHATTDGCVGR